MGERYRNWMENPDIRQLLSGVSLGNLDEGAQTALETLLSEEGSRPHVFGKNIGELAKATGKKTNQTRANISLLRANISIIEASQ